MYSNELIKFLILEIKGRNCVEDYADRGCVITNWKWSQLEFTH